MSKLKNAQHIEVELQTDELDLAVSSLNVAQVKDSLGMDKRENYNKQKSDHSRQPKCPKSKEEAMIS